MSENQINSEEFSYDAVAYPGLVIPQMNPDRLSAVARFCGMNPAPADKCRVLELGCGDGSNTIWLANDLPESEFVGVDLAKVHIIEAQKSVNELGLQNITFHQQDVMEVTEETFGKFDYIIAHGLYSWVPDFVREKILNLYNELLNENGVGFISYNVYPGCYRRRMVGDMMKFYTARFENPVEKVEQGVGFIDFLTKHTENSPAYHELLKYELESMAKRPVENIYHDDLSENNQPFYFTEFVSDLEKHGLQFVSESENFPGQNDDLTEELAQTLNNICRSTIEFEQYSDFLNCRRFRQTLICKKDVVLETEINPLKIGKLYISSLLKPTSPTIDLNPEAFKEFATYKDDKLTVSHNLTKVVLSILVNIGVHLITFDELIENGISILEAQGIILEDREKETEITASLLLQLYSPNAIGFHTVKPNLPDFVSEKPLASNLVRRQSEQGKLVVNLHGVGLNVQDETTRLIMNLLDGTKTREDLIEELTKSARENAEITDKEEFIAEIPEKLNRDLFILAKMGFLIG